MKLFQMQEYKIRIKIIIKSSEKRIYTLRS